MPPRTPTRGSAGGRALDTVDRRFYDPHVAKRQKRQESVATYPCLAPREGLRQVNEPRDERVAARPGPARRLLSKLAVSLRS
jgi:hypothetical protein